MGKKGYLRVLEAAIAAMLILGFVYFVALPSYITKRNIDSEIYNIERGILDSVALDFDLREAVISLNEQPVEDFVKEKLAEKNLDGTIAICDVQDVCEPLQERLEAAGGKNIYVKERVIASSLGSGELEYSKKIVIYAWTRY